MATKTQAPATHAAVSALSDQGISDGYIYLLGRLTVTRQQQLDFAGARTMIGHGTMKHDWVRPEVCGAYEDDWLAPHRAPWCDHRRSGQCGGGLDNY